MTRFTRRLKNVIPVLAATILFSACVPTVVDVASTDVGADTILTVQGPLDEFTSRIWGTAIGETQQDAQARSDLEHRLRVEYIADCMARQGFIFSPNTNNQQVATISEGPRRGVKEFAIQSGFGISTSESGGGILEIAGPALTIDPVRAGAVGMSASETEAWTLALIGDLQSGSDFSDHGCFGKAVIAIHIATVPPEYQAIETEVNRFPESLAVSPLMIELNTDWATCMTETGFPGLRNPEQLVASLWVEWDLIQDWANRSVTIENWDWAAEPSGPPEPDISIFQAREFELAIAEVNCREQVDFDNRYTLISQQLQQEFVDQNRAELEAWASHMEQNRDYRFQR